MKTFDYSLDDGVATVRLNRPERINALTFESYGELRDTFEAFHAHPEVRCVVFEGSGERGFCSGGDVKDIIGRLFDRDMAGLLEFTRLTGGLVHAIRTTRPPVIAKLHGVVCGAGAVISAACDLRYGTPDTRFAYLFPQVGLSGADMGAAYLLPRIVGLGRTNPSSERRGATPVAENATAFPTHWMTSLKLGSLNTSVSVSGIAVDGSASSAGRTMRCIGC